MKKTIRLFLTFVFLLQGYFVLGQFTPEWDSINATATRPTIDGVIDAVWADADSVPIKNLYSGAIIDSADLSSYWKAMYNDTTLFLMVYVEDDTLMNQEANAWSNDNVEIFLNVKQKIDVLANDGPKTDTDKMQYRVIYGKTDSTGTNADWTDVLFASAENGKGYVVEVAFPLSTIKIDTIPGHSTWIGFDLSIVDVDSTTSGSLTWSNPGGGASSWSDMDQAGIIIFSEGLPLVADTTLLYNLIADAKDMLTEPKPQETMDSLQGAVVDAQAVLDAGTANQAEIIGTMLELGAVMLYYELTVLPVVGEFSNIEFYGEAANYSEVDPWLWGVVTDSTDEDLPVVYGIVKEKAAGGTRISLIDPSLRAIEDYSIEAGMDCPMHPNRKMADSCWLMLMKIIGYKRCSRSRMLLARLMSTVIHCLLQKEQLLQLVLQDTGSILTVYLIKLPRGMIRAMQLKKYLVKHAFHGKMTVVSTYGIILK